MTDLVEKPAGEPSSDDAQPSPNVEKAGTENLWQTDLSRDVLATRHVGINEQIMWHYLTFETDLPSPPSTLTNTGNRPKPPRCPDLHEYVSPFLWSDGRKSLITILSCVATLLSAYAAGSYAPGEPQMMKEFHVSETAATVGITSFTTGFSVAPMFLAPFSEINGRRPVFAIAGILFVVFQLVCALTPTYAGLIVARFLVGCAGSTFNTMVGGVVADIYRAEKRNTAMALFSGSAIFGVGLGPLVSGFIAQHTTWRWIFYVQVITCGILMVFILAFFKETRGSVLLSRKAKTLNAWYEQLEADGYYGMVMPAGVPSQCAAPQRMRWRVKSDEERASIGTMLYTSLYRPFHLLFTEPVVFFLSLWISFSWGIPYLLFTAIPLVFETIYGFNLEQSGAVFAAVSIGVSFSTVIGIYQEKWARTYTKRSGFLDTPEGRLYFCCVQSACLPIGCFWFGWTLFPSIPWIVPTLAVAVTTMGVYSIYLAVFNYLADAYGRYASSALAAQSFCRNILAGAFPLFTPQMFRALTHQGAGSLLGGLAALLTLVPWILVFFGPKIRARSKFCREVMEPR